MTTTNTVSGVPQQMVPALIDLACSFFHAAGLPREPFDGDRWLNLVLDGLSEAGRIRLARRFEIETSADQGLMRSRIAQGIILHPDAVRELTPEDLACLDTTRFLEIFTAHIRRCEDAADEDGANFAV